MMDTLINVLCILIGIAIYTIGTWIHKKYEERFKKDKN